ADQGLCVAGVEAKRFAEGLDGAIHIAASEESVRPFVMKRNRTAFLVGKTSAQIARTGVSRAPVPRAKKTAKHGEQQAARNANQERHSRIFSDCKANGGKQVMNLNLSHDPIPLAGGIPYFEKPRNYLFNEVRQESIVPFAAGRPSLRRRLTKGGFQF